MTKRILDLYSADFSLSIEPYLIFDCFFDYFRNLRVQAYHGMF
jgi:hypothetical protein